MRKDQIANVVLVIAIVLAVILGLTRPASEGDSFLRSSLVLIGVVLGICRIGNRDNKNYLLASTILILIYSPADGRAILHDFPIEFVNLVKTFTGIIYFVLPATIVMCFAEMFKTK